MPLVLSAAAEGQRAGPTGPRQRDAGLTARASPGAAPGESSGRLLLCATRSARDGERAGERCKWLRLALLRFGRNHLYERARQQCRHGRERWAQLREGSISFLQRQHVALQLPHRLSQARVIV